MEIRPNQIGAKHGNHVVNVVNVSNRQTVGSELMIY